MAYGVKYRLSYTNFIGVTIQADVEKLDYVGSIIEYDGGAEAIKPRMDGSEDTHDPIKVSYLELSFFVDTFGDYAEFLDIDDRDYRVKLYENGTLAGIYWVIAEMISEPLETGKYEIKITAKDGLNTLKNIEYPADGRKLITTVIAECLEETGHQVNFQVDIDFNHSGESTSDQPINQTYLDTDLYRKNNVENWRCFDVLKDVLEQFSCRIQQRYGKWVITRIDVLYDGSFSGNEYDYTGAAAGTFSFTDLKTIANQIDSTHVELLSGGELYKKSAYREAWIKQSLGKTLTSSLYNGQFNLWDGSDDPIGWTINIGSSGNVASYNIGDGNYGAKIFNKDFMYISQSREMETDGSNDYILKYRYSMFTDTPEIFIGFGLKITIDDGVDVYQLLTSGSGEYSFFTAAEYGEALPDLTLLITTQVSNDIDNLSWVENELRITEGLFGGVIPDGTMSIEIYESTLSPGSGVGLIVDYISFFPQSLVQETGIVYLYGQNNPYFNFVPERIEALMGDIPAIVNATAYYKNFLSLDADGLEPTTAWNINGDATDYLINELRLRSLLNANSKNLTVKRMRLHGQINPLTILVDHLGNHFQIVNYQGELTNSYFDVTAVEIVETETNVPTITQTDYPSDPDKINDYSGGGSNEIIDTNDRVALTDEDGNIATVPGYLLLTDWDIILSGTKTIFSHKPKWRSSVETLTAGNNRVDFLNSFPADSVYRLEYKAMSGNNLIASEITATDIDGFDVWVSDDCTFDYFANLYY